MGFDWDHNAYYHRLVLRQLPPGGRIGRVLDVGCGAGAFAATLAERAEHVDAVDVSPAMIEAARRAVPANVTCVLADVLTDTLPGNGYDAIVAISSLHHLPLTAALRRFEAALRPGGVLAAVSLPRVDLPRDLPVEVAAVAGHRLLGAAFAGARAAGTGSWFPHSPARAVMPVLDPRLTTRQVRAEAAAALPGVRVRRLVFWRYLLVWQKST